MLPESNEHDVMKLIFILAVVMVLAAGAGVAANATFSKDKHHVYLIREKSPILVDLDLEKNACRKIDISQFANEPIEGVTASKTGLIICATDDAVWSYNPSNEQCVKVCDGLKDEALKDVAYDPKSDGLVVIAYLNKNKDGYYQDSEMRYLPKGENKLQSVWNRYDNYAAWINYPVFGSNGNLYFISRGDLWEGSVEKDDKDMAQEGRYGSLMATRKVPLAQLITENTSPASTGLIAIAISKEEIYGNDSRMGGSGWGSVIRFGNPSLIKGPDDWKKLGKVFISIETLRDDPCAFLCSSLDETLVFFARPYFGTDKDKVFLVKENGKAAPVIFKGLADLLVGEPTAIKVQ